MRRRSELPELLCPAGSFDCLLAAVAAGADAVYLGGKRFGARAYAKNFDTEELKRAVSYCHLHGVKLYVTLNTLILDKEIDDAVEYAKDLYLLGVDALIIADVGAITEIRRRVPDLALHASTQMSLHNVSGVDMAENLGCERAVIARELSLSDIKRITENSGIEIEVFLHGALCVCHSGQCLFSSLVGGRSGNRGECAQPCRLPYNGGYPLSLKDLSLSDHITELIDSGVASLKIEGRMKSPDYVYGVTKIYRRLLDERRNSNAYERDELKRLFSRDGFTDGYFTGKTKGKMTGMRSEEDKMISKAKEEFKPELKKAKVSASCVMRLGERASLTLRLGDRCVTAYGDEPMPAENSPLTVDAVKARLSKMGNTLLSLDSSDIDLSLENGINLPPSAINALRRAAAEKMEDFSREDSFTSSSTQKTHSSCKPVDTAAFLSKKSIKETLDKTDLTTKLDIVFVPMDSDEEILRRVNGISIPPIVFEGERKTVVDFAVGAAKCGIKYALVGNIGALSIAKEAGLIPVGDFRLNVTNSKTAEYYRSLGVEHLILSPELTLPMARDIGGGLISYGRIPLMITERCFMEENFGCERCSACSLCDRYSEKFPIIREFPHRNLILNSRLTYVGDKAAELKKYSIRSRHFLFTVESGEQIKCAMNAFYCGDSLGESVRRIGKRRNTKDRNKQ